MRLLFTLAICIFNIFTLFSQNWGMVQTFGGLGNESLAALEMMDDGNIIIAGSFEQSMDINGNNLVSQGEEDIYCSIYSPEGHHQQSFQMGGSFEEQLAGVSTFGDKINLLGSYNLEATFDNITLETSLGSKGLFLCQYNTLGEIQWIHSLEGNILSISGNVASNDNHDIIITGYFYDTLIVQEDTIIANSTEGDLFVAKFSEQGNLQWLSQAGNTGIMRSTSIKIDHNSDIIIAGQFKGEATFGSQTIQTNTADQDVFVAKLDNSGNFIWGKKLGGVFEDGLGNIAIDDNNQIYITGSFLGIMSSENGWEIQTNGFNQDAYLIQLSTSGTVNWGYALGSDNDEYSLDINIYDHTVSITGYFQGTTNWGNGDIVSEDGLDAFLANFDTDGNFLGFDLITGEDFEIGEQINFLPDGRIIAGGSFNSTCSFDQIPYQSNGFYDVYWAIQNNSVPIKNIEDFIDISFFPNPSSEWIYWKTKQVISVSLIDQLGRIILNSSSDKMYVGNLSPGVYFLKIEGYEKTEKIIIQ